MNISDIPKEEIKGKINDYSITVVYFETYFDTVKASSGTGFFVKSEKGPVFITNRHNLTGRHQNTEKPLSKYATIPNYGSIKIIGSHEPVLYVFDFYADNIMDNPIWVEHPEYGSEVDVVGILFSELSNIIYRFVDCSQSWMTLKIAEKINVLGFPFGLNNYFAIWTTGYVASEPAVNYKGFPAFLIDARTRQGQSGSLVLQQFPVGHVEEYKGQTYISKKPMSRPLGIYSGRINKESDIGIVWDMSIIREIVKYIEQNSVIDNKFAKYRIEEVSEIYRRHSGNAD